METKTKEQAGADLLAAIDAYITAVIHKQVKEKQLVKNQQICKYSDEFRKMLSRPPAGKPGIYEQYLRQEYAD
ncbi:MAG: hypothetical protein HFJ06_03940 [Lachnospiraceae bacterium]|nr:hypothetical protein [Lachnospiraceae bacterium]